MAKRRKSSTRRPARKTPVRRAATAPKRKTRRRSAASLRQRGGIMSTVGVSLRGGIGGGVYGAVSSFIPGNRIMKGVIGVLAGAGVAMVNQSVGAGVAGAAVSDMVKPFFAATGAVSMRDNMRWVPSNGMKDAGFDRNGRKMLHDGRNVYSLQDDGVYQLSGPYSLQDGAYGNTGYSDIGGVQYF